MNDFLNALTPDNLGYLMQGLWITVAVSVLSIVVSFILGSVIGIVMFEKIPYFSSLVGTLNNIVRNLPLLLIIFFTYFALPQIGIRLPVFWSTVVAMSFFEAAMLSEIIRGGLDSIDKGQFEGARSTGMSNRQTMMYIILPQAYNKMIPPLISQLISLVKDTSLASGIVLADLTFRGQVVYAQNSHYIVPILVFMTFCYFIVNYLLSLLAKRLDRHLA
ncbi:amino acid ABC transporter permease [Fructobacillus fructosus]|uniref:amino acid ABC transporter permease n=1 Tax=Fructobacillus fructosus TaxID=1631 RepID=UPI00200B013B|nr:amino acid ABC transporter permease [Fructobacillus fructosus]MCK8637948.1 amino acid ABC transporter permease [Fructobacillus fructosus]